MKKASKPVVPTATEPITAPKKQTALAIGLLMSPQKRLKTRTEPGGLRKTS